MYVSVVCIIYLWKMSRSDENTYSMLVPNGISIRGASNLKMLYLCNFLAMPPSGDNIPEENS